MRRFTPERVCTRCTVRPRLGGVHSGNGDSTWSTGKRRQTCRQTQNKSSVPLDDDNKNVVDVHDNNNAHRYAPNDSHKQSTITARFALLFSWRRRCCCAARSVTTKLIELLVDDADAQALLRNAAAQQKYCGTKTMRLRVVGEVATAAGR